MNPCVKTCCLPNPVKPELPESPRIFAPGVYHNVNIEIGTDGQLLRLENAAPVLVGKDSLCG